MRVETRASIYVYIQVCTRFCAHLYTQTRGESSGSTLLHYWIWVTRLACPRTNRETRPRSIVIVIVIVLVLDVALFHEANVHSFFA